MAEKTVPRGHLDLEAGRMKDGFWQATWDGVAAGFEVRNGIVTDETAPILQWARQRPALTLTRWVAGMGGTVALVTEFEALF